MTWVLRCAVQKFELRVVRSCTRWSQISTRPPLSALTEHQKPSVIKPIKTVGDLHKYAHDRFSKAGLSYGHGTVDASEEATLLVLCGLNLDVKLAMNLHFNSKLAPADRDRLISLTDKRIRTRKPLAYLLKRVYQQGELFYVDERSIIPRSYIGEVLVGLHEHFKSSELNGRLHDNTNDNEDDDDDDDRAFVDIQRVRRVLDMCTGSGCLAILAARFLPNIDQIDAVDISRDALEVAWKNVEMKHMSAKILLFEGDLYDALNRPSSLTCLQQEQQQQEQPQELSTSSIGSSSTSSSDAADHSSRSSSNNSGGSLHIQDGFMSTTEAGGLHKNQVSSAVSTPHTYRRDSVLSQGHKYDIIISNPPYVDDRGMSKLPLEYHKEPTIALSGGKDGLDFIHRILHGAAERLNIHGGLLIEIGRCYPQLEKEYPQLMKGAVWVDTSQSTGEVFYFSRSLLMHSFPGASKRSTRST